MLEAGCDGLRRAGYEPLYFPSILERDLYFAGSLGASDTRTRRYVHARRCSRHRVCAGRLRGELPAPALDPAKIIAHPKILVGYSDITTLLCCMADSANFVTFHGPMVAKDFALTDGVDLDSWQKALGGAEEWGIGEGSGAKPLSPGHAEGILYGGCLSMLAASLGTPHEIRTAGTILFVEDVATKPYQIDRMLMQLKLAGKLNDVRGIVFGEMLDCRQSPDQEYTLEEVVLRVVGDLGVPVAFGLRSGHVSRANITLPIGVKARLTVEDAVELRILESATVKR